jgi:hypothetical protein
MSQIKIHNQRTSVLHQNITIREPSSTIDHYKISKLPIYKQNCCNHQECDRIAAFKVFSRRLLCQTVQTVFCCQTRALNLPVFLAFHLCAETRFQPPPSVSITAFIRIRTGPDIHEYSRRHQRLSSGQS